MSGDSIPTIAPGHWRLAGKRHGMAVVGVTFEGSRGAAEVPAQLVIWRRAIEECLFQESDGREFPVPLLLPAAEPDADGGDGLNFLAPQHIGDGVFDDERTPDDVLAVLRRIAIALDALHARHFVHGALGLPSLWWMSDGSLRFPDAGLAHVLDGLVDVPVAAGSYVAPEVWRRHGVLPASDQYSLAVIAYELFTGRQRLLVNEADGVQSIAPLALESMQRMYPGAPPQLNDVLLRALSVMPGARYASCVEFVEALEGHVTELISLPTAHRFKWRRSSGFSFRFLALALVAVFGVAVSIFAMYSTARPDPAARPSITIDVPAMQAAAGRIPLPQSSGRSRTDAASPTGGSSGGRASTGGRGGQAAGSSGARPPAATIGDESSALLNDARSAASTAVDRAQRGVTRSIQSAKQAVTGARLPNSPATAGAPGSSGADVIAVRTKATASAAPVVAGSRKAGAPSSPSGRASDPMPMSGAPVSGSRQGTSAVGALRSAAASSAQALERTASGATRTDAARTSAQSGGAAVGEAPAAATRSSTIESSSLPSAGAASAPPAVLWLTGGAGARFYVDGVLVRPILGRVRVSPGAHDVDIVIPNRAAVRRRVSVGAGDVLKVSP